MKNKKLSYLLSLGIIVLVFWMIKNSLSQPGIKDMKAGFKEIVSYRNANNTGPIQRIYVVTVQDSIWSEMLNYGNFMPHTKYGNTKVYFFMNHTAAPSQLEPGAVNFDPKYNHDCVALYEKSAMSRVDFNKHPF